MKKYILYSLSIVFALSACGKKKQDSVFPTVSTITESVYASGKIKAKNQYTVYSTVSGILQSTKVEVGDAVKPNDVLFKLENIASELNTQNAKYQLDFTQENSRKESDKMQELKLGINLAREKYQLDSSLYVRQANLWKQNVGSQLEFEHRTLNFENSKTNYFTALNKFDQAKRQLQNETNRSSVNYSINQKIENDFTIKSQINGIVYDVLKENGELITPQMPLAVLGNATEFILELEVDEKDIAKIEKNQKIMLSMDSYKNESLEAIVDVIYPIMNPRSRTFKIEAHFLKAPKKLYPNLTLEANILIRIKPNVLIIPNNYIIEGNKVLINSNEKREVKIGLRDYNNVEIISGITVDDKIYLPK